MMSIPASWRAPSIAAYLATSIGCGVVTAPGAPDDGAPDPDASPAVRYDVGYVDELTLTPDISVLFGFALVVNRGAAPLDARTASVVSFQSDNPGVDWMFTLESAATQALWPNKAAGALSVGARARIVDSGLVTESIDDPFLNFAMAFRAPPPAGLTLNARATIRIDGKEAALPFVVHVIASGNPSLDNGRRVHSQP